MYERLFLSIGVFVIALVLGLFITIQKQPNTVQRFHDDKKNITKIIIKHANHTTIYFQKQAETWQMLSPYQGLADDKILNRLISLRHAVIERKIAITEQVLNKARLLPPKVIVQLNEEIFELGTTDSIDGFRYVLHASSLTLIKDLWFRLLNATPESFLSKRLLPKTTKISMISLQNKPLLPSKETIIAWQNAKAFLIQKQQPYQAINTLTLDLIDNTSIKFDIISISPFILAQPDLRIQYHLTEQNRSKLLPTLLK